ncbi:hypothetical protein C8024_09930 [Sphingopyxis sp. BSNA05]|nr:hypothetical protein [Sphingopyxis sp. BSNA05]
MEGTVYRQGEQVRVAVSLVDAESGFESWAYCYDGSLDDMFAARAEVVQAITNGLSDALKLTEHASQPRKLTSDRKAYGLYLQGRALTIRAIGDGVLPSAIELLEKALEIDPEFAECWTALAEAEINMTVFTPCLDRLERCEKAAGYAKKALCLSPQQAHARIVLAFYAWTQNDIIGALDLAFEAYRLEPNNPDVLNRVGSFLLYCGRSRDALPYIEASIDQDPVNGRNYAILSGVHLNLGNIEAAVEAGQRMVDLGFPSLWLAAALAVSGDREAAIETYQLTKKLMNTVIYPPAGSAPLNPDAMDAYWLMAAKGLWSGKDQDRKIIAWCWRCSTPPCTIPVTRRSFSPPFGWARRRWFSKLSAHRLPPPIFRLHVALDQCGAHKPGPTASRFHGFRRTDRDGCSMGKIWLARFAAGAFNHNLSHY